MTDLFLAVLNRSSSAGWLILAILLLRPLLTKAPKWIAPVLWNLVGLRLIIPFSIQSDFSLIPSRDTIDSIITFQQTPAVQSGFASMNVSPDKSFVPSAGASADPLQTLFLATGCIWLVGVLIMVSYICISHIRLSKRLKTAVLLRESVYASENAFAPFVFGVFHPRIYLPFHLDPKSTAYVIAHEQTHIKRLDHLSKLAGFILLSVHWFNPLLWVAYGLLCRDIELACDEQVIKTLSGEQRADYSQVLLQCSQMKRRFVPYPLAFGEIGVKQRVKTILTYKKPALWLTITTIIISLVLTGCFLTDPKKQNVPDKNINSSNTVSHHPIVCTDPNCTNSTHNHPTAPETKVPIQDSAVQTPLEDTAIPQETIEEQSNDQPIQTEVSSETPVAEEICSPISCTDPQHNHAPFCTGENCTDPTHNHIGVCSDTDCTDPEHGHEIACSDTARNDEHHYETTDDSNAHHKEFHH